ncbi:YgfZ/GcvT domain-containing protein [Arthrobacter roseus]|uniref:CAF17-like 4Fe-4S cluster assembly/insertion protein YgfZ n=1 Tax=Arthrobacter roseus TaxID=136274 RepID=UPI0019653E1E|nr:folate-binding protein YgfZ [Arthrobacter roseus]MBM7849358.1 folate-binding protein YgfZ [Arthrobacter roseus]
MSYRSPLLSRHGAVEAGAQDAGVAAHYGDPIREQRALAGVRGGCAVVDHSYRGVITVTGLDRLSWLNTLSSQALTELSPGIGTETLFLTIQGRIEFAAHVIDDGETAWLTLEASETVGLLDWLNKMKFALRVDIADVSESWRVLASTQQVPALEHYVVWQDPWPSITDGGYAYSSVEEDAHPGKTRPWFEYLVPTEGLEAAVASLESDGWILAGTMASEALRIAAWRARPGQETDEKTIPHELDLIRTAVHLAKGCYKGQESIARVHNLGHPPRRLVFLQLDGSQHTLPLPGSDVLLGERKVGRVTSAEQHYEMGPIALAVIKRSVDPSEVLTVQDSDESYAAAQETIVATDAGAVVGRQTGFLRSPR